jgi:hypothetical protein
MTKKAPRIIPPPMPTTNSITPVVANPKHVGAHLRALE